MKAVRVITRLAGALLLSCTLGCREPILHDLSESEVNRLYTRLNQNQISAQRARQADGKWTLSVESSDVSSALHVLGDSRMLRLAPELPAQRGGLMTSREEERFAFERALSGEIERTLDALPHILETHVHLNLPVVDPLFGQTAAPGGSASILVLAEPPFAAPSDDLAALVAGASGVDRKNISVLITRVEQRSPAEEERRREEFAALVAREDRSFAATLRGYALRAGIQPVTAIFAIVIGVVCVVLARTVTRRFRRATTLKTLRSETA